MSSILLFLQNIRQPWLTDFLNIFVMIFNNGILLFALTWLYWCVDKKKGRILGLAFFFSSAAIQTLKIMFKVPRPWLYTKDLVPDSSAIAGATGYSFPSGHSQSAASLGYTSGYLLHKSKWRWVFFIAPFIVMFSRLYFGVHTIYDVFFAYFIAIAFSIAVIKTENFSAPRVNQSGILLILLSLVGLVFSLYQLNKGTLSLTFAHDTLVSCGAGVGFGLGIILDYRCLNFENPKDLIPRLLVLIFGLLSTLGIYFLGKLLPEISWLIFFRYLVLTLWVSFIYPLIFTFVRKKKSRN